MFVGNQPAGQCNATLSVLSGPLAIQPSEQTQVTDEQFKPGDTVSLRSGGPRMTVAVVYGPSAFCEWFTDDQQPQSRSFALTSLKLDEQQ
jgi:uncharacterized protein YodC (DUF2158 family)